MRLTPKQKTLLDDLLRIADDYEKTVEVECDPHEYRTAIALKNKGLIVDVSTRSFNGIFSVIVANRNYKPC